MSNLLVGLIQTLFNNHNANQTHSLTANHTDITGGIIAAVSETTDAQGNTHYQNSKVNFTTNTLTTQDLLATEKSRQTSFGVNVGINTNQASQANKTSESTNNTNNPNLSTAGIQAARFGHDKQTLALATIGEGAVINSGQIAHNGVTYYNQAEQTGQNTSKQNTKASQDGTQDSADLLKQANINTDALNTSQVIKDTQTGGLNINTSVDMRVFSKAGREEIVGEQRKIPDNTKAAFGMLGTAVATTAIAATDSNGTKDISRFEKVKNSLIQARNNIVTGADKSETALNANIDAIIDGDLTDVIDNQATLNRFNSKLTQGTLA